MQEPHEVMPGSGRAASYWEKPMKPSDIEVIALADNATVAIINVLITFLEKQD